MTNKKVFLSLGLFAVIFVLGVGYAVVNEVGLALTGNVTANEESLSIYFVDVDNLVVPDEVVVQHTIRPIGVTTDEFMIFDMEYNDEIVMKYYIRNDETDIAADITATNVSGSNKYYTIDCVVNTPTISAGQTGTVTVTVKMIKTPIKSEDSFASFKINLNATPKES